MKVILAQGNPGPEFEQTRHNVGFLAVDYYARQHDLDWQTKSKFHAEIAEFESGGDKVLIVKPTTFYNETGKSARAIADFYKLDSSDILVIHDELMLPFGTLRTRERGSDAGNNGIKSLNAHLGEDYARIRVGTHNELADRIDSHDFVLSRFTADEAKTLEATVYPKIAELVDDFIRGEHAVTSHKL